MPRGINTERKLTDVGSMAEGKISKTQVEIYGETYPIRSTGDTAAIRQAAALVDERMRQIAQGNSRLSSAKIAVLAAMNMAGEYLRLEQDYQRLVKLVRADRMPRAPKQLTDEKD